MNYHRRMPPGADRRLSEDAKKEMNKFSADDVKMAKAFKDMMRHEGFALFQDFLNKKIGERMNTVIGPTQPGAELPAEHTKGTVFGLILARDAIPTIVSGYDEFVRSTGDAEEDE